MEACGIDPDLPDVLQNLVRRCTEQRNIQRAGLVGPRQLGVVFVHGMRTFLRLDDVVQLVGKEGCRMAGQGS